MKKRIFSLLVIFLLAITLTSCKKNKTVEVSFSSNETSMLVGEVKTITADVTLGKKVKDFELTYSISDSTKATVNANGEVTAVAEGTVLLTATGNDKNETSASITIKISAPAPTVYTITYALNGGTNPSDATVQFTDYNNAILPTPTRTGYTFLGWYEGETKVEALSQNKNYTLSAKWEEVVVTPATYTVTFKADDAVVEEVTYTEGAASIIEPTVPAKAHYTGAWEAYTLDGNKVVNAVYTPITYTVTFKAGDAEVEVVNYTIETTEIIEPQVPAKDYNTGSWEAYTLDGGNKVVNAVYTPVTYTVTFDTQGGSDVASATVNGGTTVTKPQDPTKAGYTFVAWTLDDVAYDFATEVTANITLVAKWEEVQQAVNTYTVTFIAEGTTVQVVTYEENATEITEPTVPAKQHYTGAWAAYTLNNTNIEVNAVYTANKYTITFKAEGTEISKVEYTYGATEITEPTVPAKQHYTGAWPTYTLNGDKEVVAVYTANKYTITFKADNVEVAKVEYTYGAETIEAPTVPAKAHYTGAWPTYTLDGDKEVVAAYTANKYTITFKADNVEVAKVEYTYGAETIEAPTVPAKENYEGAWEAYTLDGDKVVNAVYTQVVFTITFDVNGGTLANSKVTYSDYQTVVLPTPERTGYIFKGWYEGTTKVESLTANKDLTLKAEWEEIPANTYTVTFKADGVVVKVETYEEGAASVTEPTVPAKEHYTAKWETYTLNNTNITVNAVYTANKYTITFKADNQVVDTVEYTYGAETIEAPAVPAKAHNTGAWPTYTLDGNKEVVAVYTANKYTVTFKAEGTEVSKVEYTYGAETIEAPTVPTKEHYTAKWEAYTLDGNKEVNAIYTAVEYKVTLNANDGTVTPTEIKFTVEDTLADITLPTPTREGYEFLGWYEGEVKVEAISKLANAELTAEWKLIPGQVTVNYNVNTGEVAPAYEFMLKNFTYNVGNELTNGYDNGISTADKQGSHMNRFWTRILIKYNATVGMWESVGVGSTSKNGQDAAGNNIADVAPYVIGTSASNTSDEIYNDANRNMIISLHKLVSDGAKLYFDLGDLDAMEPTLNWNKQVKVYVEGAELLIATGKAVVYEEETTTLPTPRKVGYDFAGWYDNAELTGEAVAKIEASATNKTLNLYARYTPTKYTITYNLNGGACSATLVEEYTIESSTITLPTASAMTINNGTFVGWYNEKDELVTEIPTGSIGNIVLTANWLLDVATELTISDNDAKVLSTLFTESSNKAVTYLVDASRTQAGRYVLANSNLSSGYTDKEYIVGTNLFASLADALAVAAENDVIYMFAGTYNESVTITTKGALIAGPNYGVKYSETRAEEAVVSQRVNVNGEGVKLDGIKFIDEGAIMVGANNVTIQNAIINTVSIPSQNNNRAGCIADSKEITDLAIIDSEIYAKGALTTGDKGAATIADILTFTKVTNLTISGNKIHSAKPNIYEGMMFYNVLGEFNIINNDIRYNATTGGYGVITIFYTQEATRNIIGNTFTGVDSALTVFHFYRLPKGITNIRGNVFNNCSLVVKSSKSNSAYVTLDAVFDIEYNICDAKTVGLIDCYSTNAETKVLNNCYLNTATTPGANDFTNANDLINAYKTAYPTESINYTVE